MDVATSRWVSNGAERYVLVRASPSADILYPRRDQWRQLLLSETSAFYHNDVVPQGEAGDEERNSEHTKNVGIAAVFYD